MTNFFKATSPQHVLNQIAKHDPILGHAGHGRGWYGAGHDRVVVEASFGNGGFYGGYYGGYRPYHYYHSACYPAYYNGGGFYYHFGSGRQQEQGIDIDRAIHEATNAASVLKSTNENSPEEQKQARADRRAYGQDIVGRDLPFLNSHAALDALVQARNAAGNDQQKLSQIVQIWKGAENFHRGNERDSAFIAQLNTTINDWQNPQQQQQQNNGAGVGQNNQPQANTDQVTQNVQTVAPANIDIALTGLLDGDVNGHNDQDSLRGISKYLKQNNQDTKDLDAAIAKMNANGFVHDQHAVALINACKNNLTDYATINKLAQEAANNAGKPGDHNIKADQQEYQKAKTYLAQINGTNKVTSIDASQSKAIISEAKVLFQDNANKGEQEKNYLAKASEFLKSQGVDTSKLDAAIQGKQTVLLSDSDSATLVHRLNAAFKDNKLADSQKELIAQTLNEISGKLDTAQQSAAVTPLEAGRIASAKEVVSRA